MGISQAEKARHRAGLFHIPNFIYYLKFLVEIARRARDVDSARNAALTVFYALDDTRRLAAFGTVGRLRRVHFLLAVTCFCNLGHRSGVSPSWVVSAHIRRTTSTTSAPRWFGAADGFNVAVDCCLAVQGNCLEAAGLAALSLHQRGGANSSRPLKPFMSRAASKSLAAKRPGQAPVHWQAFGQTVASSPAANSGHRAGTNPTVHQD